MAGQSRTSAVFRIEALRARRADLGASYFQFVESDDLSSGVYFLPKGGTDPQKPHRQDEIYFVLDGQARFQVDGEDQPVERGSLIYVQKDVEHRFHSIEQDLTVLVFFAVGQGGDHAGDERERQDPP